MWGVDFDRRRDTGVVCVFSDFDAGGSVCGCMCVYAHTHTHTAHGVLRCEPRGRERHLKGPKKTDGVNLGILVLVYVCKVHTCINMPGGEMKSWAICFSFLTHFSFLKRKQKM